MLESLINNLYSLKGFGVWGLGGCYLLMCSVETKEAQVYRLIKSDSSIRDRSMGLATRVVGERQVSCYY